MTKRTIQYLALIGFILTLSFSLSAQHIKEYISADSAIRKGIRAHDKKQYSDAVNWYKKVSSNDPSYSLALYEMGLSFYEAKQYDSTVHYTSICIQDKESDVFENAYILKGLALSELEDYPNAIKNFDDALSIYPKNVNFLHNKGMVYKKSKDFQKALDIFKNVNIEYSGYIKNQIAIATLAEEEGHLTEAFLAYSHALLYSLGTKYHIGILSDMNNLAAKKLEENPKEIVFSAEGDRFSEIESLLKTQAALQKKYKLTTDFDLPVVRQLHLLFSQLDKYEPSNGYFDTYYVSFYKEMYKEGYFDRFIDLIFIPVNDPQIQKILSRRSKEIIEFAEWTGTKLATTVNKRELTIQNKKVTLSCHFNNGIKSCGEYNEESKKVGTWYYYHSNGNLQRFGQLENQKAQGKWEYFYENGKKSAEFTFKDDKKTGEYKRIYQNGKIKEQGTYNEDSLEGGFTSYFKNGNLKSKGNFVNNKYDGEWKSYYINEKLRGVYNYKEDLFDGEYTTYASDGITVKAKLNYKGGKYDGKQESFHLNQGKNEEGEYSMGSKIGHHKEYFSNGTLKEETRYENDEIIDQKQYYVNGNIYIQYNYKKGDLESMEVHDYGGNLATRYNFKNDYLKQVITYDKLGVETSKESIGKNDEFTGKWFYTNNVSMKGNYKKGRRTGTWIFYNINGTRDSEENYEKGIKNGVQKNYNEQGILNSEYEMKDGKNHGYYKSFYESGELKSEGWYIDNEKNGTWYEYYIDGTIENEAYYLSDNLEGKYIDYDPDGNVLGIYYYKDGEFKSYENYDRDGKILNRTEISESKTSMIPCTKLNFTSYKKEKINGLNEGPTYSEPISGIYDFKGNYTSGKSQGSFIYYFNNGQKYTSSNYILGNKNGMDTTFYINGYIYSTSNMVIGNEYGKYNRYYYNGNIWIDRKNVNENRDSIETIFGINGEILVQKHLKIGYLDFIVRNNESGELIDTLKAVNETISYEAKYKNGQVGIKEVIKVDNLMESKLYDDKGQLIYNYEGDEIGYDIKREFFYTNGKPLSISLYDKGQLKEKSFYRLDGSLISKEDFKFGQTHGKSITQDEQGNIGTNLIYRKNIAYELGK